MAQSIAIIAAAKRVDQAGGSQSDRSAPGRYIDLQRLFGQTIKCYRIKRDVNSRIGAHRFLDDVIIAVLDTRRSVETDRQVLACGEGGGCRCGTPQSMSDCDC